MAQQNLQALTEIITRLPSGLDNLHLTFVSPQGTNTFASENADRLRDWWHVQCGELANPDRTDFWVVLFKRELTGLTDPETGVAIKRLSVCRFGKGEATKLTAAETQDTYNTDAYTGEPLPLSADLVFADFE